MIRTTAVVVAVAATLALAGCAASPTRQVPDPSRTTAAATPVPSATVGVDKARAVKVAPLDHIAGAKRITVRGVGIDIPAGWRHVERETPGDATAVQVFAPSATKVSLALVVAQHAEGFPPGDVHAALGSAADKWRSTATGIADAELVWSGVPAGSAMRMSYTGTDAGDGPLDIVLIGLPNRSRTALVIVAIMGKPGVPQTSDGYQVLRTLRFDG